MNDSAMIRLHTKTDSQEILTENTKPHVTNKQAHNVMIVAAKM